ncbi:MAG: DUF87 domain-containing protein [Planctomycetes bacterium]|nr:DUF87 domain-containing protein [Planctomycetota bacterium]
MDIHKLARKLKPLMPKEVDRWLKARETADPDLRDLIDKQIVSVAHRKLGDGNGKILLSLPPPQKARGAIHLGTVLYEREKWPAGISSGELLQNLAIFGRSGAGKTNVSFHILEQLAAKKIPFLFLDWKRTARHMLPRLKTKVNVYTPGRRLAPLVFNPFIPPPGLEPNVYINQVVDILADAFTLGDGARSVLQRALSACRDRGIQAPTVKEVLADVGKMPGTGRAGGWKISAIRALESLDFADLSAKDSVSQERLAQSFLRESTIIELDALTESSKKFLVPLLLLWLFYVQLAGSDREKLKLVVFIEEAHHLLYRQERRSSETLMNMLLRQCREVGLAMVVIDQHPHMISSVALGNSYTSVCLNLKDPSDINKAAAISGVEDDEKWVFSALPVGQGVVKLQDRWRRPFLVGFPLVGVKKGSVGDAALARYIRRHSRGTGGRGALSGEFGRVSRSSLWEGVLSGTALQFLEDVHDHEDDGVKRRYQRLGLSAGTGTRLKEELVDSGWLDAETVAVGRSRKVLLRLSTEGRRALGIENGQRRESIAHAYWKRFYARRFANDGYKVEIEAARVGGQIDVLAVKNGERVGIEVETGKSDVVANVRNCLLSRLERVFVVTTDEAAMRRVERQLAEAGLMIPSRVQLVLRGGVDGTD